MHVEDVIGGHRRRGRIVAEVTRLGVVHEAQGRAAAAAALHLQEREVVAPGQEADPIRIDGFLADRAGNAVDEAAQVILGIHSPGV